MMRPDSPSWIKAKRAGDLAELAAAAWWKRHGFTVHKALGQADHDLRIYADMEVKNDMKASETGSIAIEVSYRGQPSGIMASRATYWFIVMGAEAVLVRTDRLRELISGRKFKEVPAGDRHDARVRLVPVDELRRVPKAQSIEVSAG